MTVGLSLWPRTSVPTRETIELAKQEGDRPVVPAGSGGQEGTRQFPAYPVCMEVPVRIHGSEVTSPVPGVTVHSELFHEETRTLIVFPQGAVVRLSASVTQGQALVLTNQRTTAEVACRVVNVRSSSNIEDYVELEFTRSAPGFWGISFPSEASSATASTRPAASAKFEGPAGAVPPPPSAATVSDAKGPVANTDFSTGTPSVKFPAEIPAPANRPIQPAAIVGTKKKEEPRAVDAPAAELTALATEVEPPPPGPAPSQEVSSVTQQSEGPTEASVPMEVSARAEPRIDEPPATGSLDQESAGVGAEAEVAALVSETISLLAASEAQAKESPVMPAPPTREEKPSTARPPTADSFPASFERTERGARTAREDSSVARTLAARFASHLPARPEFAKHRLRGKLTLVFVSVSVVALVLGGTWLLLRHYPASRAATSVTQNPIAVQTPAPTDAVSQLVPASEPPGTQPQASAAAGSQTSLIAPAPAPTAAAPKEQLKQSADNIRVSRTFSKLSTRLVPPRSVSVSADAPVPTIGSEVTSGMPGGQLSSAVGAVMPGVSRPGLAPAPPPPGQAQVPPRVGGQVKEPRLVSAAKPLYPSIARQGGVEGDVVVETEIDATGRVTRMKAVSGPGLLRQAAMDALRQWKYEPGMLDGQAIAVEIQVTIRFRLR